MAVKGVLPLGCLPPLGREGVTLLYTKEDQQVTGKRGFLQSQKNNQEPDCFATKSITLRMHPSMFRYSNWANRPTSGIP
jgi:hypothetical protein